MMTAGNWADLNIEPAQDPVRGEPGAVRSQASALQQQAQRWEEQARALQGIANEGDAMKMEGEFAAVARRRLRAHPQAVTAMARGCSDASKALNDYATQLEQEKRNSQRALVRGTQAKRTMEQADRRMQQINAQLNAMPRVVPYPQLAYYQAQYRMLQGQWQTAKQAFETAKAQWKIAQNDAFQAGQRAGQQENSAAQKVMASAPSRSNYDLAG